MWEAKRFGASAIGIEHILLGLLEEDPDLFQIVGASNKVPEKLRGGVEQLLPPAEKLSRANDKALPLSAEGKRVAEIATYPVADMVDGDAGTEHLLLAVIKLAGGIPPAWLGFMRRPIRPLARILVENQLTETRLLEAMKSGRVTPQDRVSAVAKRLCRANSIYYVDRHEYRDASPADFAGLDRAFYEDATARLVSAGFKLIGDFEDLTASQAYPHARALYRALSSADGFVVARIRHHKGTRLSEFMEQDAAGRGRIVEFETEFSDGHIVWTTQAARTVSQPESIAGCSALPDVALEDLLDLHRARTGFYVNSAEGITSLAISSVDDLRSQRDRITRLRAQHRQALGGGFTLDELAVSFPREREEFVRCVFELVARSTNADEEKTIRASNSD